ncbi:EEF1A lysine methyltransferase 2-like [Chenopodium quinoa]|uniref:EEF1A lysine methyltransferase 2-like n=1 Tax=Chenopodium quinoa TaxID=63459 RepID=UPI000B793463|nr:EEF1A lysine methyltransferase 2-like [Chenopodium quinoa]
MAGIKLPPAEDTAELPQQPRTPVTGDLISDDDRSIAADSWSIKSEYGSTLDDEQRHADATEALAAANLRPSSDYSSDKDSEKDAEDGDGIASMLGLQSYWDATYSEELENFRQHGHAGEIWFGPEVMDTVVSWTKNLCIDISRRRLLNHVGNDKTEHDDHAAHDLSSWSVLDLGTGNGLLLQELAKHGFSNLTGVDYSEGAIGLARALAERDGFNNIAFSVDDVLDTKLEKQFKLVMDKGTLDAIGLHPDGPIKRLMYWDSVAKLVAPGGILVVTSCNSTKDELMQEVERFNQRSAVQPDTSLDQGALTSAPFQYVDHIRSYPTFMFGGVEGSRVATVAFLRN